MNDNEGKPKSILVVNTDVTEQRQLEEQFLRAQRLENIGTLAGGIAHDLNNIFGPILLGVQILKKRIAEEKTLAVLNTMEEPTQRGAELVRQVLSFARGNAEEHSILQTRH